MDDSENPSCSCCFWPILLLILAFDCYLATQLQLAWRGTDRLKQQNAALATRIEQAEGQMKGLRTWPTVLEGVAKDLLEMAKTDSEVRKIVDKYQIRQNAPVAPAPESDASK